MTEAGTANVGVVKSAVGIGTLLAEGIGDTIRVSLSADPVEEVRIGIDILKALGLREGRAHVRRLPVLRPGRRGPGRRWPTRARRSCRDVGEEVHVAVMGCEVNGPGEARAADVGVAGGKGIGLIFRKGEVVRKVPETQIVDAMWEEVQTFIAERQAARAEAGGDA